MNRLFTNKKGTTFIEILLYISIFLILTPILLSVSVYSMRTNAIHNAEKDISFDSRFLAERIYDLITQAKKVDVPNSIMENDHGKLVLNMQNGDTIVIWLDPATNKIILKENGVDAELSSSNAEVERLYFEAIPDIIVNPNIVLGIAIHMGLKASGEYDTIQDYVLSANLEAGDFDGDGCTDVVDSAPDDPTCCGNVDGDTVCNEKDNCVRVNNPEQEDSDADGIGNACDDSPGGGTTAYNCVEDDELLAIINKTPPLSNTQLKEYLISSSPLSNDVLNELITKNYLLDDNHFGDVFIQNVKLDSSVYAKVKTIPGSEVALSVINAIQSAQESAINQPVFNASVSTGEYDVAIYSSKKIKLTNEDIPLGSRSGIVESEFIEMEVHNPTSTITVTTHSSAGEGEVNIDTNNTNAVDALGFQTQMIKMSNFNNYFHNDYDYTFSITALSHTAPLEWISFDFGVGAQIEEPSTYHSYYTDRYTIFCAGGCSDNCGDSGTGILVTFVEKDMCYTAVNGSTVPWSYEWYSYLDDNSVYGIGTYLGGKQSGEQTLYIEKTLTSILSPLQKEKLQSITIGGDVSYQSKTGGTCTNNGCPMKGTLVGDQNIELYNWTTGLWEVIGAAPVDGTTSNQQKFEVKYTNTDVVKYISESNKIKTRMEFHWDGTLNGNNSPAILAIDYLVAHLKWSL